MSRKKMLLSILFFILVMGITFYCIFSHTSLNEMIDYLSKIRIEYSIICILLLVLYFSIQSIYMKVIYKSLNVSISFIRGFFYSIVEFFFSAITPFSSGGQPIQLTYMTRDKIPVRKSLIVLAISAIFSRLFLVVCGLLIMLFYPSFVINNGNLFIILFIIGVVFDFCVALVVYLLLFKQKIAFKIVKWFYKFKDKLFKKDEPTDISEILENYKQEVKYVKDHPKEVIIGCILTFLQRLSLFFISFVIYKAFGFNEYNFVHLLMIQIGVQIAIEGVPLPGGTGISDYLFRLLYVSLYGDSLAVTGSFLTRLFTFYLPVLVISIIVVIVTRIRYIKEKEL